MQAGCSSFISRGSIPLIHNLHFSHVYYTLHVSFQADLFILFLKV